MKWNRINELTDSEIARENTKSNAQRFNESCDSAYFKEKFLDVTMNELGFSEDEIEGLIEQWNQDYDSMSDIIIKFLDGKPLERLEQIQAAYYIGEKLATSKDW